jgi:hypothetical protein
MIEVGSIVESIHLELHVRNKSNHGLVISLMGEGKVARVFWMATQQSGFCSVKDLKVIT